MDYKEAPKDIEKIDIQGLARDIVMWYSMGNPTGTNLHKHLQRCNRYGAPKWLELYVPETDIVPAKAVVAYIIYRAIWERLE